MDNDGDYYENDFIDDSEYLTKSAEKSKRKKIEDEFRRTRSKVGVVCDSSDEDGMGRGSKDNVVRGKKKSKKKIIFASSSEESEEKREMSRPRKRMKRAWSSDEGLVSTTTVRLAYLHSL